MKRKDLHSAVSELYSIVLEYNKDFISYFAEQEFFSNYAPFSMKNNMILLIENI
jgi:hypothetical protein